MNKLFGTLLLIVALSSTLFAQSYQAQQHTLQLDESAMTALYNGSQDLDKMADFFFTMDYADLEKKVKAAGLDADMEEGTMYMDGKHLRMDMETMGQKMSYIINLDTKQVYSIMHAKKEYYVMNLDELKAMQSNMQKNMAAQMENMKGMMENLPPEAKAMMEKMTKQKKSAPPKVTATGKTKTINGFSCSQYLITKENSREQLWVTTKYGSLRDAFQNLTEAMPDVDEDSKVVWKEVKEGWPVQNSELRGKENYMEGSFSINEIYSLKETTFKAGTFDPPAGYTKRTMQEMMGGMQGNPH